MLPYLLVVEDNPDDELLLKMAWEQTRPNSPIEVVRDGAAALEFLEDPHRRLPRMVLLDLKLPKLGGLEVLRWIRSQPRMRAMPVVVFSSSKEERDLVDSYDRGCNSFVSKPVDFGEYQDAVRDLSRYWMSLNQLPGLA